MKNYSLFIPWLIALTATVGSLFYSELYHIPPCNLCWYQRTLVFPLTIILGIAAFRGAYRIVLYTLPLTLIGLAISSYHLITIYALKGKSTCATCMVLMETRTSPVLPFPVLGFLAFLLMSISLIWIGAVHRKSKKL